MYLATFNARERDLIADNADLSRAVRAAAPSAWPAILQAHRQQERERLKAKFSSRSWMAMGCVGRRSPTSLRPLSLLPPARTEGAMVYSTVYADWPRTVAQSAFRNGSVCGSRSRRVCQRRHRQVRTRLGCRHDPPRFCLRRKRSTAATRPQAPGGIPMTMDLTAFASSVFRRTANRARTVTGCVSGSSVPCF